MWPPINSYFHPTPLTYSEDEYPISTSDKEDLKPQLVPAMIALSGTNEKTIRAQIAESVSLIAELDFPERWPNLIDVRYPFLVGLSVIIILNLLAATRTIPQQQRFQHQPRRFTNCPFNLPFLALASPLRRLLVHH
jgi:hypothetical protein